MAGFLARAMSALLMISSPGLAQGTAGNSNAGDRAWGNVAALTPGARIKVSFKDSAKDTKGQFVSSDQAGLNMTRPDGTSFRVARSSIKRLQVMSEFRRQHVPWIGAAAGAAALGAISSRPSFDFVPTAVLMFTGVGAAIGYGIGMGFRYTVVYETQ
jgi:hypothetical protein